MQILFVSVGNAFFVLFCLIPRITGVDCIGDVTMLPPTYCLEAIMVSPPPSKLRLDEYRELGELLMFYKVMQKR